MAKLLSHTFSTIKGSVGDLTYKSNQHAQIIVYPRQTPLQPNTTYQLWYRNAVRDAASMWNTAPESTRQLWNAYAPHISNHGPLGPIPYTGRTLFMGWITTSLYHRHLNPYLATVSAQCPSIARRIHFRFRYRQTQPPPSTRFLFTIYNFDTEPVAFSIIQSPPLSPTRLRYKGPWDPSTSSNYYLQPNTSINMWVYPPIPGATYFFCCRCWSRYNPHRANRWFIIGPKYMPAT